MSEKSGQRVIKGLDPLEPLVTVSLGKLIYQCLLDNSAKCEIALVDAVSGQTVTHLEILTKTCNLAGALTKNGCNLNTIVSVISENSLDFYIPIIACMYIGAIVAPINPNYLEHEVLHTLCISKPKLVFCSKVAIKRIVNLKNQNKLPFVEKIIIMDDDTDMKEAESIKSFVDKATSTLYRFSVTEVDVNNQVAFILYSSGTTGLPKGVMLTHTNIMARYIHIKDPRLGLKGKDFIGYLAFFHGFGLVTTFAALLLGQRIIVIGKYEAELFLKTIQDYRISHLCPVPPQMTFFAKSPLVEKYDLSSLTDMVCGAAPLSKEVEGLVKNRLKLVSIRQAYGLTETTTAIMGIPKDVTKPGSCGKLYPYMLGKVIDPQSGKALGPNQSGELCFKGAMVMKGYYDNEEATKNIFTSDGFVRSGDLGHYDQDEFFFVDGRLKELIKYKGYQVAPAELEAVLLTNPKIKDAGVIGVSDEEAGELPLAFVVKKPECVLLEKEVIDFVAERVSAPKRLRGGVIFVSSIPKNPTGKILRRELQNLLPKRAKL